MAKNKIPNSFIATVAQINTAAMPNFPFSKLSQANIRKPVISALLCELRVVIYSSSKPTNRPIMNNLLLCCCNLYRAKAQTSTLIKSHKISPAKLGKITNGAMASENVGVYLYKSKCSCG